MKKLERLSTCFRVVATSQEVSRGVCSAFVPIRSDDSLVNCVVNIVGR